MWPQLTPVPVPTAAVRGEAWCVAIKGECAMHTHRPTCLGASPHPEPISATPPPHTPSSHPLVQERVGAHVDGHLPSAGPARQPNRLGDARPVGVSINIRGCYWGLVLVSGGVPLSPCCRPGSRQDQTRLVPAVSDDYWPARLLLGEGPVARTILLY